MSVKGDEVTGPTVWKNGRYKYKILVGTIMGILILLVSFLKLQVPPTQEFSKLALSPEDKLELKKLGLTPRDPVVVRDAEGKERKLYGRFLHITDMHPDLYYVEGTSVDEVCHRGEPKDKKDYASRFGKATSGCDAPVPLINRTLSWIENNLRDKIDFVIWTGDNIRHDNDRNYPRTEDHIFALNGLCANIMHSIFGKRDSENPREFDVTVVPSIGNNDVFPHNLLALGPTLQTREYYKLWAPFIPQDQLRVFHRGVCFVSEVIPGKLAVMSVNTLYLFKANPLVDTCDSKKEPGYQLLIWMGTVLEELRQRGVKVWLSGHVPPTQKNMEGGCFHKYTLWTHEYRDIIIGGVYGHMNMDHFIPLDSEESWRAINEGVAFEDQSDSNDDEAFLKGVDLIHEMGAKPVNKDVYMQSVRENSYKPILDQLDKVEVDVEVDSSGKKKKKKKKKKKNPPVTFEEMCDRYSIVNIAGSVVPTFNPAFRVWEYNITGLDQEELPGRQSWDKFYDKLEQIMSEDVHLDNNKKNSPDKTIPKAKPSDLPLGPGYEAQLFSPTKFVQYYADLDSIDKEYRRLIKQGVDQVTAGERAFDYKVEYTSQDEPYPMSNLLVRDYITLASNLAGNKTQWKEYVYRSFISSGYKDSKD
ncbi:hypothetical protein ZYGR_0N05800 [Zygosaccharomyces rouxii]|uniref:Endopolyphosphatase n=2 Tax=Zygosaccharomyces rouxii TaxID=4956 RepID=C5DWC1_ZYGRC|nr:uncharacterized protein ZYRO0D13618g [Zygosaccharomyces rouxii]KAH9201000.1 hypothetical protein LQ764DRAFT_224475 [Zygosaccharomyces rouxii]GAV49173.1 hypothetical protein ZYGR_0N05800 [Zygosaccharomyces rouxii]CAR28090.1 ZYRO0D13618p [Zygosaccharomyces rouxii]